MQNDSVGRILIVDDEEAITALLRGWIATSGFDIEAASNGREAMELARTYLPHAILMDASMPVMGGFETLLALKKDPDLCDIPVIFLTVRNDVQDVVNALDTGAADYLTKPFKPQILLARLRAAVRFKKSQDSLRQRTSELGVEVEALAKFIDKLTYGVMIVSPEGTVLYANRLAGELLAQSPDTIEQAPLIDLLQLEGLPPFPWQRAESCDTVACPRNNSSLQLSVHGESLSFSLYSIKLTPVQPS